MVRPTWDIMGCSSRHHMFLLLLLRHTLTLSASQGDDTTFLNLTCTNDLNELISCQLEQLNCTGHSLTLQSNLGMMGTCSLRQCGSGLCCCSVQMMLLTGDQHLVTVWDRGRQIGSKTFAVKESVKPSTPTIISVNETKGNLEIMWNTNMRGFIQDSLRSELTYYKKGDPVKRHIQVNHTTVKGLCYYKLPGRSLEPSTSYIFSVRSILDWNKKMSDSSTEREFKTSDFSDSLNMPLIISLSIAAVIGIVASYFCFVQLKAKWWEKPPTPKLGILHLSKSEVFKPVPTVISSISVDAFNCHDTYEWSKVSLMDTSSEDYQKTSECNTESSFVSSHSSDPGNVLACVQRALANVFPNINLVPPLTADPLLVPQVQSSNNCESSADSLTSGSSGFMNITYSLCLPGSCPPPPSVGKDHTEMLCDPDYQSCGKFASGSSRQQESSSTCPVLQHSLPLPGVSFSVMTDMTYKPCTANSGSFGNN